MGAPERRSREGGTNERRKSEPEDGRSEMREREREREREMLKGEIEEEKKRKRGGTQERGARVRQLVPRLATRLICASAKSSSAPGCWPE